VQCFDGDPHSGMEHYWLNMPAGIGVSYLNFITAISCREKRSIKYKTKSTATHSSISAG
jgi:hypothetical protein